MLLLPMITVAFAGAGVASSAAAPITTGLGPACKASEAHGIQNGKAWGIITVGNPACKGLVNIGYWPPQQVPSPLWESSEYGYPNSGLTTKFKVGYFGYDWPNWCFQLVVPAMHNFTGSSCIKFGVRL
ncbi:MAG: hypothetical protein V9E83_02750 [Baekduia sp.]